MSNILDYLKPRLSEMGEFLRVLVECESPTDNKEAVNKFANLMVARLRTIGAGVEIFPQSAAGNHLRVEWDLRLPEDRPPNREDGQVLVLCHMDTVWPLGEVARRPFRLAGSKAYGPGAYDMKGGIVMGYYAVRALRALGLGTKLRTVFIYNSDEETQSHSSRDLIEAESKKSKYVLNLEPKPALGTVTTSRKSVATLTMEITGKASHAGAAPRKGISAIHELAHQILHLHNLTDLKKGTTVTVGIVSGGIRPNVVPPNAKAIIDVRVFSPEEDERIRQALRAIKPVTPGTSVAISGGEERPLWLRTPQAGALFERARAIADGLGLALTQRGSGGVSDANFAGALGIPTLDGLGPDGEGGHALDEYVELSTLVPGTALIAELLRVLD